MNRDQKLLQLLTRRREMSFAEIGDGLGVSEQEARERVRHLVTKKLFTGYINWDEQTVYPRTDMDIEKANCPACGSVLKTTPRGTKKCDACGSEICLGAAMSDRFLSAFNVDGIIEGAEDIDKPFDPVPEKKDEKPTFPYLKPCPNCNAQVDVGGKLKATCPYCGTEIF
jgi:rRNA maturation endonuclease Nob1